MPTIDEYSPGTDHFLMGNEAISRGALEAGVHFASAYPGTPSSEIIQRLSDAARAMNLHVEWSTNEKVAAEGAAAAAFAGLRSLVAMKNAGLSVALDYLTHLAYTGLGDGEGAMVTVVCDDPDAHSSGDETDSRWLAKFACTPLLEPTTVQEAKALVKWAFELSEEFKCNVMFRGYTRLCHASSTVSMGTLKRIQKKAVSDSSRSVTPYLAKPKHAAVLEKLERIRERFEASPFNGYQGPEKPELLILCGGSGLFCAMEALDALGLTERVGILRLGTLWPFPTRVVQGQMAAVKQVLVVEEVDPFIEMHLKELLADAHMEDRVVYGKGSKHIPAYGEITPDRVIHALSAIFELEQPGRGSDYQKAVSEVSEKLLVSRGLTWCAGCPHRASFWALGRCR